VLGLVLKEGAKPVTPSILVGLASAYAATRVLRSLLYDISPREARTFLVVSPRLTIVAMAAFCIPRRAMKVDPVRALRNE